MKNNKVILITQTAVTLALFAIFKALLANYFAKKFTIIITDAKLIFTLSKVLPKVTAQTFLALIVSGKFNK